MKRRIFACVAVAVLSVACASGAGSGANGTPAPSTTPHPQWTAYDGQACAALTEMLGLRGLHRIDANEQNMPLARLLNQQAATQAAGLVSVFSSTVWPYEQVQSLVASLTAAAGSFAGPMTVTQANDVIDSLEAQLLPIEMRCGEVQAWVTANVPR